MSSHEVSAKRGPPDGAMTDFSGAPDAATRRLSDKILSAFNHAYAVGEFEVANLLRGALIAGEAKKGTLVDQRRRHDPLYQADLWVAFVEARNDYRGLCESQNHDVPTADAALSAMKDAYRRWSVI